MGQMLVSVIFTVLNGVAKIFLLPIYLASDTLFPVLGTFFSYVFQFLTMVFTYLNFVVNLLMIPKPLLIVVAGMGVGIFAFNTTIRLVGMGMAIYHYFKP